MRHSTGKPTKEEEARIIASKEGECVACIVRSRQGKLPPYYIVDTGCDYNHTKSGNKRRGHMFGYALCLWHHRRQVSGDWTHEMYSRIYGPSLMDGSRLFHEAYGSDDYLIDLQTRVINGDV